VLAAAPYSLITDMSGQNFFNNWSFYGNYDVGHRPLARGSFCVPNHALRWQNLTNGDVIFVNQSLATTDQLAYINSAGNAILRVRWRLAPSDVGPPWANVLVRRSITRPSSLITTSATQST
jgi:hypothetical protein